MVHEQRVKVAYANGVLQKLYDENIDVNSFVKTAHESGNSLLIKVANAVKQAQGNTAATGIQQMPNTGGNSSPGVAKSQVGKVRPGSGQRASVGNASPVNKANTSKADTGLNARKSTDPRGLGSRVRGFGSALGNVARRYPGMSALAAGSTGTAAGVGVTGAMSNNRNNRR